MSQEMTLELSSPITTESGQIRNITLRSPKMRLWQLLGEPFELSNLSDPYGESVVACKFNSTVMGTFLYEMTSMSREELLRLSVYDFMQLRGVAVELIASTFGGAGYAHQIMDNAAKVLGLSFDAIGQMTAHELEAAMIAGWPEDGNVSN